MKIIGKILWWDSKYQRGVVIDGKGNEYFFDSSTVSSKDVLKLKKGKLLTFEHNRKVKTTLCAHKLTLITAKSQVVAARKFEKSRQLEFEGA